MSVDAHLSAHEAKRLSDVVAGRPASSGTQTELWDTARCRSHMVATMSRTQCLSMLETIAWSRGSIFVNWGNYRVHMSCSQGLDWFRVVALDDSGRRVCDREAKSARGAFRALGAAVRCVEKEMAEDLKRHGPRW